MAFLSIVSLILANVIFRLGPVYFVSGPPLAHDMGDDLIRIFDTGIRLSNDRFYFLIFCFSLLGLFFFLVQLSGVAKGRRNLITFFVNAVAVAMSALLLQPALTGYHVLGSKLYSVRAVPLGRDASQWTEVSLSGFTIKMPAELRESARGSTDPAVPYSEGDPVTYAGFIPGMFSKYPWWFERFELGIAVRRNEEHLTVVEYMQRKNELLKRSGWRVRVLLVKDVVPGDFEGMEDTLAVDGPRGRYTICRTVFSCEYGFLVMSAVVGAEQIIPEYKRVFDEICATVGVSNRILPEPSKVKDPAGYGKKIGLDIF
jgi:hypothetical protein